MSEKLSKTNQERVGALALKDQVETQIVTIQVSNIFLALNLHYYW